MSGMDIRPNTWMERSIQMNYARIRSGVTVGVVYRLYQDGIVLYLYRVTSEGKTGSQAFPMVRRQWTIGYSERKDVFRELRKGGKGRCIYRSYYVTQEKGKGRVYKGRYAFSDHNIAGLFLPNISTVENRGSDLNHIVLIGTIPCR